MLASVAMTTMSRPLSTCRDTVCLILERNYVIQAKFHIRVMGLVQICKDCSFVILTSFNVYVVGRGIAVHKDDNVR